MAYILNVNCRCLRLRNMYNSIEIYLLCVVSKPVSCHPTLILTDKKIQIH